MAVGNQLLRCLVITWDRLVLEPQDSLALVTGEFGSARDDTGDLSQLRLHRRASGVRGHGVAVQSGKARQSCERQRQTFCHPTGCDNLSVANTIDESGKYDCTPWSEYASTGAWLQDALSIEQ